MKEPQDAEIDLLVCKTMCFNNPVSFIQGCHGQRKILENIFFPGQVKVREFHFQSGKYR